MDSSKVQQNVAIFGLSLHGWLGMDYYFIVNDQPKKKEKKHSTHTKTLKLSLMNTRIFTLLCFLIKYL